MVFRQVIFKDHTRVYVYYDTAINKRNSLQSVSVFKTTYLTQSYNKESCIEVNLAQTYTKKTKKKLIET